MVKKSSIFGITILPIMTSIACIWAMTGLTPTGSSQPASFQSSIISQTAVGFVPYSQLGSMPAAFVNEALVNIAQLPTSDRTVALSHLNPALASRVRKMTALQGKWLRAQASAIPQAASGCNVDVCIDVGGSGTYVTYWNTQAFGNSGCIFAHYLVNGRDWGDFGPVCPTSNQPGVYYNDFNYYGYFYNNDKLCNTWDKIPGEPCEYIRA